MGENNNSGSGQLVLSREKRKGCKGQNGFLAQKCRDKVSASKNSRALGSILAKGS
jgi:hypothetical protein